MWFRDGYLKVSEIISVMLILGVGAYSRGSTAVGVIECIFS